VFLALHWDVFYCAEATVNGGLGLQSFIGNKLWALGAALLYASRYLANQVFAE